MLCTVMLYIIAIIHYNNNEIMVSVYLIDVSHAPCSPSNNFSAILGASCSYERHHGGDNSDYFGDAD